MTVRDPRPVSWRAPALAATVGLLVVLASLVLGAAPASAHAALQSTTPADRSNLDDAPSEVVLQFNEPVSSPLGGVRAFDIDGDRVDQGELRSEDGTLTLGLRDGLGDGAYVVTYRVISEDGHPITGAFTFTVGDAEQASDETVAGLLGSDDDRLWDIAGGIARFFAYAGTLLAAGVAVFAVTAHDGGPEKRALRRLVSTGSAVGAVGVLLAIPFSAARITGLGLGAITEEGVLGNVLGESVGISSAIVLAGLVVLAGSATAAGPFRKGPTIVAALAASGGFALAGHTVTAEPRWAATAAAAVHVAAAALWFGGLVALGLVLHRRRDGDAVGAAAVVARFSSTAALSLLAVAVCGLYLGFEEVGSLDALTSTTYGKLLLAKTLVVALVAAGGAWNRFRLVPSLERAPKAASSRLRTVVRAEAIGLAVAIAITAALVNTTPAADVGGGIFSETVAFGDGSVNVVVDPNQAGPNLVHLYFYDAGGRVADPELDELTISFSMPASDIGPIEREPVRAGLGHHQVTGMQLLAGTWELAIVARVDQFDQVTTSVDVPVNP